MIRIVCSSASDCEQLAALLERVSSPEARVRVGDRTLHSQLPEAAGIILASAAALRAAQPVLLEFIRQRRTRVRLEDDNGRVADIEASHSPQEILDALEQFSR